MKKVGEENAYEFHNTVTWTQQFKRVGDAPIGLKGKFRVSVCEGERCLPPKSQAFAMGILQTAREMDGAVAIGATSTTSGVASTPEARPRRLARWICRERSLKSKKIRNRRPSGAPCCLPSSAA